MKNVPEGKRKCRETKEEITAVVQVKHDGGSELEGRGKRPINRSRRYLGDKITRTHDGLDRGTREVKKMLPGFAVTSWMGSCSH